MSNQRIQLENKVREIIMTTMGGEESEYTPEANLKEDIGADSLDAVEIIMNVEKEFNIVIDDKDAEKMGTIRNIVDYLESQGVVA